MWDQTCQIQINHNSAWHYIAIRINRSKSTTYFRLTATIYFWGSWKLASKEQIGRGKIVKTQLTLQLHLLDCATYCFYHAHQPLSIKGHSAHDPPRIQQRLVNHIPWNTLGWMDGWMDAGTNGFGLQQSGCAQDICKKHTIAKASLKTLVL